MADKLEIANQALALVASNRLLDWTDDTPEGNAIRTFYETSKRAVLAAYPWRFARKRASLAAHSEPPAWGFKYQYSLPVGFITIHEIENLSPFEKWEVESNKLLINRAGPLNIIYVADVTESDIPDDVVKCMAAYLAAELALLLPESPTTHDRMMQRYGMLLDQAQFNNAKSGSDPQIRSQGSFLVSRGYRSS